MHWVSAAHAVDATVALYERLFAAPRCPVSATGDAFDDLDPDSRELLTDCKVEPALGRRRTGPGRAVRATRLLRGRPERADVFHRTVGLRDEWANIQKRST